MSTIEPYKIIGTEIANIEVGSIRKPHFYKITSGQLQKNSLLFHGKIGHEYYVYRLRTINLWKLLSVRSKVVLQNPMF